jgi:hypothetical protein
LLLFVAGLAFLPLSQAFFSDQEKEGVQFQSSTLALDINSDSGNFQPSPSTLNPGETLHRTVQVSNSGQLDLQYQGSIQVKDNDELCQFLVLTVSQGQETIYQGHLDFFSSFDSYQFLAVGDSQELEFNLLLPQDAAIEASEKSCGFDLVFSARQVDVSGFTDQELLDGNQITAVDFNPPPVPTDVTIADYQGKDLGCQGATNHQDVKLSWSGVCDDDSNQCSVEMDNGILVGRAVKAFLEIPLPDNDGTYRFRVKAIDPNNNNSLWTDWCKVILDRAAPQTSLTVGDRWLRTITNQVANPGFEINSEVLPTGWSVSGDVSVVESDSGVVPTDGLKMVRVGEDKETGNYCQTNSLTQEIPNTSRNLSFWYNFFTKDRHGFDQPGFSVWLDNRMIFQLSAGDVVSSTGWKQFFYLLPPNDTNENSLLTLTFQAGNTGDELFPSWVYLDRVSTGDVYINGDTKFFLTAPVGLSTQKTFYQRGGCHSVIQTEEYLALSGFSFNGPTDDHRFCFWSSDMAGNTENPQEILLNFNNQPPDKIGNLETLKIDEQGNKLLHWTAPNGLPANQASQYDIRYAPAIIHPEDWDFLAKLPMDQSAIIAPQKAGSKEELIIPAAILGEGEYWLAIRSADAGGLWSEVSNISYIR